MNHNQKIQYHSIKKLNSIIFYPDYIEESNDNLAAMFNVELMNYGYILSKKSYETLEKLSISAITELYNDIIPVIQKIVGGNVKHKPFYPNFPKQVEDADKIELYTNAILHYLTHGSWSPEYDVKIRNRKIENIKLTELDFTTFKKFEEIYTRLLESNDSLSQDDKNLLTFFLKEYERADKLETPQEIPYKENMCILAACMLEQGNRINDIVKTPTDILRVVTHLSDGDISLAENTKFKSFPRKTRKLIIDAIGNCYGQEEDFIKHTEKWKKLMGSLHIGDYAFDISDRLSDILNGEYQTWHSSVEQAIQEEYIDRILFLLKQRPAEFCRYLLSVIEKTGEEDKVLTGFMTSINKVPTRTLTQLIGRLKSHYFNMEERVIMPKNPTARITILPMPKINVDIIVKVVCIVEQELVKRFSKNETLENVYIDPSLNEIPLPSGQRSASTAKENFPRGSKIPLDEGSETIRFFIYWKGEDIDLSCVLYDDNFENSKHISYTNLKDDSIKAYHSGDITYAPNGASEFIDIDMKSALNQKMRYVSMNVMVYSGENFSGHEICFAGWMLRNHPNSNEIYEPNTVKNKFDMKQETRNSIPVIFDLLERKVIYADMTQGTKTHRINNVENNSNDIRDTMRVFSNYTNRKMTIGELLQLHTEGRGKIVQDKDGADIIFDLNNIDINKINSEYLK